MDRTDRQLLWVGHSCGRQKGIHRSAYTPLIRCFACLFCLVFIFVCYVTCARDHFCYFLNQSHRFFFSIKWQTHANEIHWHNGIDVWWRVTNFPTFPHILKGYLLQRCFFLHADLRQILSSGYNSKWNPMSISVRLYYDFIWLNGRNRRTLDLVRRPLKSTAGSFLLYCCTHRSMISSSAPCI